jgi:hypothetical protein
LQADRFPVIFDPSGYRIENAAMVMALLLHHHDMSP